MSNSPKVLILNPVSDRQKKFITHVAPAAIIVSADIKQAAELIHDVEILVAWGFNNIRPFYGQAKNIRWIHAMTAGVESLLFPETQNSPVLLSNSKGIHGIPMAEHVLGLMLSFTRRLNLFQRQQQKHLWARPQIDELHEINGKTLAIVGLGAIGHEIAKKAKALDMTVIAAKREITKEPFVDRLYPAEQLLKMLADADFVVVTLPLTEATTGLFGQEAFAAMKPSAYFINVSRGAVVQEDALLSALQSGAIAGAGLDVFVREPLPETSPFWDQPNVIITPHVSAISPVYLDRALQLFSENLACYIAGKPLLTPIDKVRGY
jgi:phosphoglycerate dehydrogenase-like enzyme